MMSNKAVKNKRTARKSSNGVKILNIPYVIWSVLFIIIPIFIVAYFAFTDDAGNFTFANLQSLADYKDNIIDSFVYAIIATVITLLLAYPFAYFMTKCSPAMQKIMNMLIMVPIWMNLLILTYSIMNIIEANGLINNMLSFIGLPKLKIINTPEAVIFGMIYNYFPYMVLPLYSVLSKIDNSLLEAASDLGSNTISRFRRVILPLSVPGIISGVTMVFVPSVSTFYISQKLGGTGVNMIGDIIESLVNKVSTRHIGAMLSLALMIVILVCLMIMNRFSDDDDGGIIL